VSAALGERTRADGAAVLAKAVLWDLRLQARYQILTVAAAITALYCVIFQLVPESVLDRLTVVLIFSDPTTIGFLFVGVLVLFERGAGTLQAVIVSPLSPGQYLWSKALSLTTVAVVCAVVMAVVGQRGFGFDVALVVVATALTSVLLVLIGFSAVVRVRSVNAYLVIVPLFLLPLTLPLLPVLGLVESPAFSLIPTTGSVVLLDAAVADRPLWEIGYGVGVLLVAIALAHRWALASFEQRVRRTGG
jgi:fluoroquinolone transport system permease protein